MASELNRLRSADQLIQECLEIQEANDNQTKLTALIEWRDHVGMHQKRFN